MPTRVSVSQVFFLTSASRKNPSFVILNGVPLMKAQTTSRSLCMGLTTVKVTLKIAHSSIIGEAVIGSDDLARGFRRDLFLSTERNPTSLQRTRLKLALDA